MRLFFLIVVFLVTFFVFNSFAQELFAEPMQSDWDQLVNNVKNTGSATWYATAFLLVQSLFLIFRTALGEILGIYKLLVLASLSLLVTIGTNIFSGKSVFESLLLDSGTLMAYQVLVHEAKVQWKKRNANRRSNICDACGGGMRDGKHSQARSPKIAA